MNQNKINLLFNQFPKLYSHTPDISCGDGWFNLIHSTSVAIEYIINKLPPELQSDVFASQVKEKFGTLRYYMNAEVPEITGAISVAEEMSIYLCEVCGNVGTGTSINGWLATLCEQHHLDRISKNLRT